MTTLSRYYHMLLINIKPIENTDKRKKIHDQEWYHSKSIEEVQYFIERLFTPSDLDCDIQAKLFEFYANTSSRNQVLAHLGLRCYISSCIKYTCQDKVNKFGKTYEFTLDELLIRTLDKLPISIFSNPYIFENVPADISLTTLILETFDPNKGSLSNWVKIKVRCYKPVKIFFLEKGFQEASDWSILCGKETSGLRKNLEQDLHPDFNSLQKAKSNDILRENYQIKDSILSQYSTKYEIDNVLDLLEKFHQVYRQEISLRKGKKNRSLPQPSNEQLQQIGSQLKFPQSPEEVLSSLQKLARFLRAYRHHIRSRGKQYSPTKPATDSRIVEIHFRIESLLKLAIHKFVTLRYQELLVTPSIAKEYLLALHLFYCQSYSMVKIGEYLGGYHQTTVTRRLVLDKLREKVSELVVQQAPESILSECHPNYTPQLLNDFQVYVENHCRKLMEEDSKQALNSKSSRNINNPFAKSICQVLKEMRDDV